MSKLDITNEDKAIILEQINEMIETIKAMETRTGNLKEMAKTLETKLANLKIQT